MSEKLEAKDMPLVTSLSDSDTILAVGADGNGKRIAERHVGHPYLDKLYSTEEERWIRIAEVPGGTISLGEVFVTNSYYSLCPRPIILSFCFSDSRWGNPQYSTVNLLCGTTAVFTKARLVHPNQVASVQPCYIEVYVSRKTERRIISGSIFLNNATLCNEVGSIPEGYLAKEFDLTESVNRGGVNRCTYFAEWRKGGLHERYNGTKGTVLAVSSGNIELLASDCEKRWVSGTHNALSSIADDDELQWRNRNYSGLERSYQRRDISSRRNQHSEEWTRRKEFRGRHLGGFYKIHLFGCLPTNNRVSRLNGSPDFVSGGMERLANAYLTRKEVRV